MRGGRWRQAKTIFEAACELERAQRETYLNEACADDRELRDELESLLASWEKASAFLDTPALELNAGAIAEAIPDPNLGRRLGAYRLVREIGRGGMGAVYEAVRDDQEYRQRVAVKLIAFGLAGDFPRRQFLNERQILAEFNHPNIARLLDGGTTADGQPYLVMEFIQGVPLIEYCEQGRLTVRERLGLFRTVCAAVQAAHQRLIVHRDLKPSNILVDSSGTPKLLDFGIAKALGADAPESGNTTLLCTPEYASPEQVRCERVTTATDVYSLGVILYRLLTGHAPYPAAGLAPHAAAQIVCEAEPATPGVPSDLETILRKALQKAPERRYDSVEQFSEDIRRYLAGFPVSAQPDTTLYRAAKFARRHTAALLACAVILLLLAGGLAATLWQYRIARTERATAERRFNDTRALANSLIFEVHDSISNLPGSTPARKVIVARAIEYLDRMAKESNGDSALQRELAQAYQRLGRVQGDSFQANLGDSKGALQSFEKATALWTDIARANPNNVDDQLNVAYGHRVLGNMGGAPGALENARQALAITERIMALHPENERVHRELQREYESLGGMEDWEGKYASGLESVRKALRIAQDRFSHSPDQTQLRLEVAELKVKTGYDLARVGFRAEGLQLMRSGLLVYQDLARNQIDAVAQRELAVVEWHMGEVLSMDGDLPGALAHYRSGLERVRRLSAADPQNAALRADIHDGYTSTGRTLVRIGRTAEGLDLLRRAARMANPDSGAVGMNRLWIGEALARRRDLCGALDQEREGLAHFTGDNRNTLANAAAARVMIGALLVRLGKSEEAAAEFRKALAAAKPLVASGNEQAKFTFAEASSALGIPGAADAWKQIRNPGVMSPNGFACCRR